MDSLTITPQPADPLVDFAARASARYLQQLPQRHVAPDQAAVMALAGFDETLPTGGEDPLSTLQMLDRLGSPATTATAGGRFFGLVVGASLPVCVSTRWLTAAWDQVVFNEATSAVGVKLEQVAARWLLQLFDLPADSSVGFVSGATMGNFSALAAARDHQLQQLGHSVASKGLAGAPRLRIITSAEIHVTVIKALAWLGFGSDDIERVATDDDGAVLPDALPPLDRNCIVCLQAGNVNSGAMDPIGEISRRARAAGAWVHVDGAFGLWAAVAPGRRHLLQGFQEADSWVVDGHKWLNTPYDCGMVICRHPLAMHAVMATQAPYLNMGGNAAPKDMVPEFSRGARGADVWAALRTLGRNGLAEQIERNCRQARQMASLLEGAGFTILNRVTLNQLVAAPPRPELSAALAQAVQASGLSWFGNTRWKNRDAIRLSFSSWATCDADIELVAQAIIGTWQQLNS